MSALGGDDSASQEEWGVIAVSGSLGIGQ